MFTEKQTYEYPKKLMQGGRKISGWQEISIRIKFGVIITTNVSSLGPLCF